jgi:capsule biosynthesis phosphatase
MNYLITAAGHGSRFCRAGIKPPKPLIRVKGRELLLWSLSSFAIGPGDNLYIVALRDHRVPERLDKFIQFLYPDTNVQWLELSAVLDGQLLTTMEAIRTFDIKGPLVIHNCDTYHDATKIDFNELLNDTLCFGIIPCFDGEGDHWSFVRPSKEDPVYAEEVAEKVRISKRCSVGTYGFSSAEKLLAFANDYFESRPTDFGEYYIAPIYQYAIDKGEKVRICPAETTRLFGTPEELLSTFQLSRFKLLSENAWDAHQRGTLVVDIDGTLCGGPVEGDYSLVQPIHRVCEALRKANESGYYIVLFTARNMQTFKGSLGLINKYTAPVLMHWLAENQIPYDEIYFGKPWGPDVNYIDDKSLSIDEFTENHS